MEHSTDATVHGDQIKRTIKTTTSKRTATFQQEQIQRQKMEQKNKPKKKKTVDEVDYRFFVCLHLNYYAEDRKLKAAS